MNVKYCIGNEGISNRPLRPFSEEVLDFAAELSAALMQNEQVRKYPDIVSFAFWCRKANLQKKSELFQGKGETRLGRGLVFHIAPSNVPVNFAFSYLFSLLSGNANIVRLPSKDFPQVALLTRVIDRVLENHKEIRKRTAMVQYPAGDEATVFFGGMADARMIWGGDATVAAVRACKPKPRCVDIVFADRYSICVLDGSAVEAAKEAELKKLAEGFYNDTYRMDQNASSSPQMIFWRCASAAAKERFWKAVYDYADARYELQPASSVDKYTKMCQDAVELQELGWGSRMGNLVYRAGLNRLSSGITGLRGSCGYFYEYDLKEYGEILPVLTEKFQTVTYYGIDPNELRDFILSEGVRGIDRIVPVGKALEIDVIWDGYDVIGMLSRIVEVQS